MLDWIKKPSLQIRILFLTVLIVGVVLGVSDKISTLSSIQAMEEEIGVQTSVAARRLADTLEKMDPIPEKTRFYRAIEKIMELVPNIIRVDLYEKTGDHFQLLLSTTLPNQHVLEDFDPQTLQRGDPDLYLIEDEDGANRRMVAMHSLPLAGNRTGVVILRSSLKSVTDLIAVHSRILTYKLMVSVLLLVASITLVFRTTVYRSIRHLIGVMHRFQQGESSVRVREQLPGEFGEIAFHFNSMLEQISQFQNHMQRQVHEATATLEKRNQELETLNLLLYETQKRLLQSERLALVGQLTATFAHEIGSPLSAVSTHLQVLQEKPHLDPAVKERLSLAEGEITRLCGIVESLLANTRRSVRPLRLNLCEILQNVVRLLGPTLQSRNVKYTFSGNAQNCQILGNPDQLQQMFLNLFNNSLDAVETVSERFIFVELGKEPGGETQPSGWLRLDIRDSGAGIASDKLPHIFEPFFTTKEFGKGTGLGLAVCQEIMRKHGGKISVSSPQNQGAVFTLWFPEYSGQAEQGPETDKS